MPVTDLHPEHAGHAAQWRRCRDAFSGGDAVRAARTEYLPALGGQELDPNAYEAYLKRALFYNATARTVAGVIGMVFRKPAEIHVPDSLLPWTLDVTGGGVGLGLLARDLVREILVAGRCAVLVDLTPEGVPYLVRYPAEAVTNWATGAQGRLRMVTLREEPAVDTGDVFSHRADVQYRVLSMEPNGCVAHVWRKPKDGKEWIPDQPVLLTMRGAGLPEIPIVFFGPTSNTAGVERPPLLDLVDVNLSHYRTSADLEHGRHFTALPTPWAAGFRFEDGKKLVIGPGTAWTSTEPQARCGMLEFTGQGLGALEKALEEKESKMVALGARLLENARSGPETATAVRLRLGGDTAVVQALAASVSAGLTRLAQWALLWSGLGGDEDAGSVSVKLNSDLYDEPLAPQMLAEMVKAWQAGVVSWETVYANLQAGDIARAGVSAEEELALIRAGQGL